MSAIEWCDRTWNPVVGCSRVSSGCDNCYAIGVAARNLCDQHKGLTRIRPKGASRPGVDWTGEVRLVPERLGDPLKWKKPQRIFVNSMSDLFHSQVPIDYRAAVFAVMGACPQHTFIIVTKRPGRGLIPWESAGHAEKCSDLGEEPWLHFHRHRLPLDGWGSARFPLPNVHILVSAEDQRTWNDRVPALLEMPAAVRGVSAEPLLGSIHPHGLEELDWLVIGGESGRGARPCSTEWIRHLRGHAERRRVPTFVKQLGSSSFDSGEQAGKGNDMATWPEDLRVRDFPRGAAK